MIVLDTSAAVEFLVGADRAAERARELVTGHRLAAPHALDLECASSLRGLVLAGKLPARTGGQALDLLLSMRIERHPHAPLLPRIWELRHNMWPYDAAYAALAETLGAELVTADGKLTTVPGITCAVRNVRDA